jgi:F-type H+-transporting ATPase subunit c
MTTKTTDKKETSMNKFNKSLLALATLFVAAPAFAQDTATAAMAVAGGIGWVGISVGIMMGLAVLGGTLGQSRAAVAALEGIARNPAASEKFTVPLILSLALMESLVLFAFVIGFSLQGSINTVLSIVK